MSDIDQDEPLDPKVEAIRRKMVRLLAVSGGIMMVGLMTVLIAIVYRLNSGGEPVAATTTGPVEVTLPTGAELIEMTASVDGLSVTVRLADGLIEARRYGTAGNLLATYQLLEE